MNPLLAKETKVLIIDNQVLAKGYMRYSLEELGFRDITYVDKISLALTHIRRQHFDLIICAYSLKQELDGYYFYEEIKNNGELPITTAFIFISADTTAELVQSIVELQPDDFIAKPFTVKDLDRRLSRILSSKKALHDIYSCLENNQYPEALSEVERFLAEPKNAVFFPLALKTKGEILSANGHFQQAKNFYTAILKVQRFTWAELGLVRAHLHLDEDESAEKLVLELAFKPDSQLAAYDLLLALQIKQHDFDAALECVMVATEISPRNIRRHKAAMDLSRITHDYDVQFEAAKKIVKFAKNSIHDKPENYLNVARAGIDYAMTVDETDSGNLIKQSNEYIKQFEHAFPKAQLQEQVSVIRARLLYLQDEKESAKALMEQLEERNWQNEDIDALLDKAKALHDVGLHERSQALFEIIKQRCEDDPEQDEVFVHYIHQEKQEKTTIRLSSKELNNVAVEHYRKGDVENAMEVFGHAFTIMPKNAAIALNLLQAIGTKIKEVGPYTGAKPLIEKCMKTIDNCILSKEQEERYQQIRAALDEIIV